MINLLLMMSILKILMIYIYLKKYFLRISKNGEYKVIIYYPIFQCGEVLDFTYLYG